jgi:hypothetical protein
MKEQLKIPSDLESEDDDGDQLDGDDDDDNVDEDDEFGQFNDEEEEPSDEEELNEVFNLARENNEMADPTSLNHQDEEPTNTLSSKPVSFANPEMMDRIAKLE